MTIALKPVTSSQIAAIGYDLATRTLAIRFNSHSRVYQYQDVPPEVAAGFATAESTGKYFHANVRGKFNHTVTKTEDEASATPTATT